ncbi:MAG: VWA domain-containing protein [Epsilonproteobacteria bacterium]|nr:VWA domain-containing protein [Campylobacterota bacterium]
MSFYNPYAFWIFVLLLILFFIKGKEKNYERYFSIKMLKKIVIGRNQNRLNLLLLLLSFIFLIIALARPIIVNKPLVVSQSSVSLVVAFDISKSMMATDVYPNRFLFAKNKFYQLLSNLKNEKIGAIAFSSNGFLIAPLTSDYRTVKYLVDNLSFESISVSGSLVGQALDATSKLLDGSKDKTLLIFTDGCDSDNFQSEIDFAKNNNIKVFIYAIGTKKGSTIEDNGDVLKDENGNIVITKLNENIKQLAFSTSGAYLEYSPQNDDIVKLLEAIREKSEVRKISDVVINDNEELFYIPLIIGLLFFMVAISGFKRIDSFRRRK